MLPWIPDSDVAERAGRLREMLAEPTRRARVHYWLAIRLTEDQSVLEAARWCKAVQSLRGQGAISAETAAVLIKDVWEDIASLAIVESEPEADFLSRELEFYQDIGEDELARLTAENSEEYRSIRRRGYESVFGVPDHLMLAKPAGSPSERVSECMNMLRAIRKSRAQRVGMSEAIASGHTVDEWYEAIQRLCAASALSYPEALCLIKEFLETPGLGPATSDREYRRLEKKYRAAVRSDDDSAGHEIFEQMTKRRKEVIAAYMRAKGDVELAELLERDPRRFSDLWLEGHAIFEGDRQLDLRAADANEPSPEQSGDALPLDDESVAVRWCVGEIRKLLEKGIKKTFDLQMAYMETASTDAWFRAIQRARADGELNESEASFLFDWFLWHGSPTPFADDAELSALSHAGIEAIQKAAQMGEAASTAIFDATEVGMNARRDILVPAYYERMGESTLASLYASDREGYEKRARKGQRAFASRARRSKRQP